MNTWYRLLSLSIILSHDLSVSELQLIDPNFSGGSSGRDQGTLSIRNNLWRLLARQGQHRASCKQVTLDLKYLNLPLWYIVYIYPNSKSWICQHFSSQTRGECGQLDAEARWPTQDPDAHPGRFSSPTVATKKTVVCPGIRGILILTKLRIWNLACC